MEVAASGSRKSREYSPSEQHGVEKNQRYDRGTALFNPYEHYQEEEDAQESLNPAFPQKKLFSLLSQHC